VSTQAPLFGQSESERHCLLQKLSGALLRSTRRGLLSHCKLSRQLGQPQLYAQWPYGGEGRLP
jgi:hypothetical protein